MLLPEVPAQVTGEQIQQVLDALGVTVPIEDIQRMVIEPRRIALTTLRRNEQGNPMSAGGQVAQIEVDIAIRWAK